MAKKIDVVEYRKNYAIANRKFILENASIMREYLLATLFAILGVNVSINCNACSFDSIARNLSVLIPAIYWRNTYLAGSMDLSKDGGSIRILKFFVSTVWKKSLLLLNNSFLIVLGFSSTL